MKYGDVPGFCKNATTEEIANRGYILTPSRYVGAQEVEDDNEPFEDKMKRLIAKLGEQRRAAARLDTSIRANLQHLGYED